MTTHIPLQISAAQPAENSIEVRAPYDHRLLATIECAGKETAELALSQAMKVFQNRDNWLPLSDRINILKNVADIMAGQKSELALLAASEGGKPLADSQIEVDRAIDGIHICIEHLRTYAGEVIPMGVNAASKGRVAFSKKEPIGVVVAISAFNHPLNLIVHQVAPAIAAGCPVIVKPSEETPLSCFKFVEILREAGLPEVWCQPLVVSDVSVAEKLVSDPRVGFFSFIGSAKVGWMLRSKLAPGARCALEHGGLAPVILAEDADLKVAVPLLAKGGFYHAGQVCVSVQRVFVHESVADEIAQDISRHGSRLVVGDPTDEKTEVGPLIKLSELNRVQSWINEAIKSGAKCYGGNKVVDETCFAPTVLFDPPVDAKVSTAEIFGPVICVYPYSHIEQAIERANALDYAFQASVFTNKLDTALMVSDRLSASAVMINDHTAFRVDWMPFAGLKHSGLGVGGIPHTMNDMCVEKMIVMRSDNIP